MPLLIAISRRLTGARFLVALLSAVWAATLTTAATAQSSDSFYCRFGDSPACLGSGETVCPSRGKCVEKNTVVFADGRCSNNEFVCGSDHKKSQDDLADLRARYNKLADDYNELMALEKSRTDGGIDIANSYLEFRRCSLRGDPLKCAHLTKADMENKLRLGGGSGDTSGNNSGGNNSGDNSSGNMFFSDDWDDLYRDFYDPD